MPKTQFITYDGKTLSINEWALLRGINPNTIRSRLAKKMPTHDVLSQLNFKRNRRIYNVRLEHNSAKKKADRRPWTLDAPRPSTGHQRFLTVDGKTRSYAEWSVISGVPVPTIAGRLSKGAMPEDAIRPAIDRTVTVIKPTPRDAIFTRRTMLTFMDEAMTIEAWAIDLDVPVARIIQRCKAGDPVEACLSKDLPPQPKASRRRQARPGAARMRVPTIRELALRADADAMQEAA